MIDLSDVGGAIAACDRNGRVTYCSPSAQNLLSRMGATFGPIPMPLPVGLWQLVSAREVGEAVQWRGSGKDDLVLGCTRYRLGREQWLLVMSEISQKQDLLSRRLHEQRLRELGGLVASTAHDLRAPLASIVFNSEVLDARIDALPAERVREAVSDIKTAASRLRGAIESLLDYARVGPSRTTVVTLTEILGRLRSLLRPAFKAGSHRLIEATSSDAERVIGNLIAIEQIFVNLVLNSIEAAVGPATVRISSSREGRLVRILVEDDGPGISPEHMRNVFDPFFTTKHDGTGLGLSISREAARAAGGDLQLVQGTAGAAFAVLLPAAGAGEAAP